MSSFPQAQTQPYPQNFSAYQTSYAHYSAQTHYPSANYNQVPATATSFLYPPSQSLQQGSQSPARDVPSPPDPSNVTPEVASQALQRFISTQVKNEGFDGADPAALRRLELEVAAFVVNLYQRAHEYANLANRAQPVAQDLLLASEEHGLDTEHIGSLENELKRKERPNSPLSKVQPVQLVPAPKASPPPKLLSSDDEGTAPAIPSTLRTIPHYYPPLPPKHTYLRTPPSPPKKQALPSLEKRLKNASLVQESLRNLMLATEETAGLDDGELLGAIVNWEATGQSRKRSWRVSTH
ncbi:hypothetical protein EWM64_g4804 [Hericium alpestre]|uniref:Transcription initiation factor TFIID subunit 8 n=1 Tax=Hericium alpestre TaxID=135208 RepID=A0A4Z0A0I5_9AGAM|nr:hypothetical protein EWM64_g4804 [Hericium alpestre]